MGQTLLGYFPITPNGLLVQQIPTTASNNEFGVKFDYKLGQHNSIAARYVFGDSLQSGPPFAGLQAGGNRSVRSFQFLRALTRTNGGPELDVEHQQ